MENIEKKFGTAKVLLEMKDGKIVNFDIEGSDLNVVMCILNLLESAIETIGEKRGEVIEKKLRELAVEALEKGVK